MKWLYERYDWVRKIHVDHLFYKSQEIFFYLFGVDGARTKEFLDADVESIGEKESEGCAKNSSFTKELFSLYFNRSHVFFQNLPEDSKYDFRSSAHASPFLSSLYFSVYRVAVCSLHLGNTVSATAEPIGVRTSWIACEVLTLVWITWIDWCSGLLCLAPSLKFPMALELTCKQISSCCCKSLTRLGIDGGGLPNESLCFLFRVEFVARGSWEMTELRKVGSIGTIDGAAESW